MDMALRRGGKAKGKKTEPLLLQSLTRYEAEHVANACGTNRAVSTAHDPVSWPPQSWLTPIVLSLSQYDFVDSQSLQPEDPEPSPIASRRDGVRPAGSGKRIPTPRLRKKQLTPSTTIKKC